MKTIKTAVATTIVAVTTGCSTSNDCEDPSGSISDEMFHKMHTNGVTDADRDNIWSRKDVNR